MPKITQAPHRLPTLDPRMKMTTEIPDRERSIPILVDAHADRRRPEPPAGAMMPDYPSTATSAPQLGETPPMTKPSR